MTGPFQLFGALAAPTEAALRASISRFGVLVPVVIDQRGRVLDGHHRQRIAAELKHACPTKTIHAKSDEDAKEIARSLNEDRRQLTQEQRLPVVTALREEGHSVRAIAGALGVGKSTVQDDLKQLSGAGQLTEEPKVITGLDGKKRPAKKKTGEKKTAKPKSKKPSPNPAAVKANGPDFKQLYEEALEKLNDAADTITDLDARVRALEVTDPTEQQKEILRLERENAAIKRSRDEFRTKSNELIRQVKSMKRALDRKGK